MDMNTLSIITQTQLDEFALECFADPLKFVLGAFPWQISGTVLADEGGPDVWQREVLEDIREHIISGSSGYRHAIAAGHGVGKSTLSAFLILWFMATRVSPQVVCTANTQQQLRTKTWRELAKWHKLCVFGHLYKWTATMFYRLSDPETWFAAAVPWSLEKPEAFQGTHEKDVLIIYDEASAIPDVIWEATEGAMTTPGAFWFPFGNPTRNTGRFKECFPGGRFMHRWQTRQIDATTAKKADQGQICQWIDDYGEDSDFVRIRVKGLFPRSAAGQFIGDDLIALAHRRFREGMPMDTSLPIVMGVDVARYGDDRTVVLLRQGPMVLGKRIYRDINTMQTASYVVEMIEEHDPTTVFVDVVGIGAGVVDRLHQLGYRRMVVGVSGAEVAHDAAHYHNKRAEMWGKMREWLKEWARLDPADRTLPPDLVGVEYGYDVRERLQLEKKDDMKKRGLASPDEADALALTFVMPVRMQEEKKPEETVLTIGEYEQRWMA
jgi:hypothetical protein